ncbi:hypothetical protein D9Q98_010225 [Chlorella vulgaris]|uniref:Uncharacterized protein n=1 Tax=Chlorella vulgaris TaxID=3077 RepID=A0A9D4YUS2_CHLVU|nr:hypothetical protein D9Q98_010225 [Chlorella vulgaris]
MHASAQTFKAGAAPRAVATRTARRSAAPIRCEQQQGLPAVVKEAARTAALAAATLGLLLGSGAPAEAAKRGPTALERKAAYQQELLETLRIRGAELPGLASRPQGVLGEERTRPSNFKLDGPTKQSTVNTPARLPTPLAAVPATVAAPSAALAIAAAAAPAPTPASAPAPRFGFPSPAPAPGPVKAEGVAPAPAPVAAPLVSAPKAAVVADPKPVLEEAAPVIDPVQAASR